MPPRDRSDLVPGTLDLLILKTLTLGSLHGYGIAQHIERLSDEVLQLEQAPSIRPSNAYSARVGSPRSGRNLRRSAARGITR